MWSFAPSSYPAYPAVVKRQAVARQGGGSDIHIDVLSEAKKQPCDDLVRTFNQLTTRAIGR